MTEAELAVQFVVDFAQKDLSELRSGDWLNLQEDLARFLQLESGAEEISRDEAIELQAEAKDTLTQLIDGLSTTMTDKGEEEITVMVFRIKDVPELVFSVSDAGFFVMGIRSSNKKDLFRFALGTALGQIDITYIRRCPVCQRMFLAEHGRQMFHDPKCQQRAGTQRYREKQKQPTKKRKWQPIRTKGKE